METLGKIVAFFIVLVVSATVGGYTLSVLWGWFFVTTFGLPSIGIAQGIGITITAKFLLYCHKEEDSSASYSEQIGKALAMALLLPIFPLFVGWVVKYFI